MQRRRLRDATQLPSPGTTCPSSPAASSQAPAHPGDTAPRPPLLRVPLLGCPDQTLCPFQVPPQTLPTSASPFSRKVSHARPSPYPAALREEGVCTLTAPRVTASSNRFSGAARGCLGHLPGGFCPSCAVSPTPRPPPPSRPEPSPSAATPRHGQAPCPLAQDAGRLSPLPLSQGPLQTQVPGAPPLSGTTSCPRLALNPLDTFTGTWVVATPSFQAGPATCCRVPHSHVVGSTGVTTSKWPALSLTEQDCRRASPAIGDKGPGTGLSRTACLCSADLRGHGCSPSPARSF